VVLLCHQEWDSRDIRASPAQQPIEGNADDRFPGERPLGIIVNLPVAIPTVVVGTSLLLLWGPIGLPGRAIEPIGLQPMFTPVGVLLAHLFVTFPLALNMLPAGFMLVPDFWLRQ
jgi:ABC-type sulfate transport system permease component